MAEALNVKLSTLVSGIETPINPATTAAQVSFGESNVDAELKALQNAPEPNVNAVSDKAKEVVKLRKQIKDLRAQMVDDLEKAGF